MACGRCGIVLCSRDDGINCIILPLRPPSNGVGVSDFPSDSDVAINAPSNIPPTMPLSSCERASIATHITKIGCVIAATRSTVGDANPL
jgi:hypothetical protein